MQTSNFIYGSFFVFILLIGASCNPIPTNEKENKNLQLGELSFQVSGAKEAIPHFEKGVLLLHSFEYEDAREAFQEAQQIDSTFAMAYWGEAMTYNHSLWQKQEKEKAVELLNQLAPTAEQRLKLVKTELEKDFMKAIEVLYSKETKYESDIAYKDFMEQLTKKYPNNHEVSAFYAISLLGSARNGRDEELYNKSARIAQGILKENPNHPGALHYLIHSYDDPRHAHLALGAADEYAVVAPDAAHALHMPSHIYVALGKWNEVVSSNIASWNASIKRKDRKGADNLSGSYHALNWLQYGLLQRGEVEEAAQLVRRMESYTEESSKKKTRAYLIAMKGAQLVETDNWTSELVDIDIKVEDLNITKQAGKRFLDGMILYHQGKYDALEKVIKEMSTARSTAQLAVGEKGFAMCSTGGFANKPPNQLDIDMSNIMEMELKAYRATSQGKEEEAKEWFEKGIALDESLNYSFGPPTILKPVHEAYAEWLLSKDKTKEAFAMFDKSLKRHPRRLLSLQGKKKAAALLGKDTALMAINKELEISLAAIDKTPIL